MRRWIGICVLLGAFLGATPAPAQTITTAFTYQGELHSAGIPASGQFDFRFRLYDAAVGGAQVGPTLCIANLTVDDGRFTVEIDFGPVFSGAPRYLQIDVRAFTGLACGNTLGFVTLTPRQTLTATPYASFALNAANANQFGNQTPSFFQNASNLNAGTIADARLSTNVTTLSGPQTFTGTKSFTASPAFNSAGAPFTVSNSTRITNLNADLLDGLDSSAFAVSNHTHDAAAIVSGTLNDARIPSTIARLNLGNVFSNTQSINVATQTPLTLIGSNTGGTWINLQNSGGGRTWNFIATGSTNGEGAGKLLVRDQTGGAVRATIDPSGRVGLGTTSPEDLLHLSGPDAGARIRNTNDTGGGLIQNTFGALQLGLFNPTASPWGAVPANSRRFLFGMNNAGRVGTLTNTGSSPVFRNTIDDGSGNAVFQGTLSASNMPRAKVVQTYRDIRNNNAGVAINGGNNSDIDTLSVNIPGPGVLMLRAMAQVRQSHFPGATTISYFKLEETTGSIVVLNESAIGAETFGVSGSFENRVRGTVVVEWTIPVTAGSRSFKTSIYNSGPSGNFVLYYSTSLSAVFIPDGL